MHSRIPSMHSSLSDSSAVEPDPSCVQFSTTVSTIPNMASMQISSTSRPCLTISRVTSAASRVASAASFAALVASLFCLITSSTPRHCSVRLIPFSLRRSLRLAFFITYFACCAAFLSFSLSSFLLASFVPSVPAIAAAPSSF